MRFLILSDIHGDKNYIEKIDEEFAKADAVLFAGDFAEMNKPETGLTILNTLVKKHDTIFSVIGNCDEPAFLDELENLDVSVEKDIIYRDGLVLSGSGGTLKFTLTTPNEKTDEEMLSELNLAAEVKDASNMILVLHHPPIDTNCDKITSGIHVGSKLFRKFIEEHQPLAVICGHIHESAGIDYIGKTLVINPGALMEGHYAVMEIEKQNDAWKITNQELKEIK